MEGKQKDKPGKVVWIGLRTRAKESSMRYSGWVWEKGWGAAHPEINLSSHRYDGA